MYYFVNDFFHLGEKQLQETTPDFSPNVFDNLTDSCIEIIIIVDYQFSDTNFIQVFLKVDHSGNIARNVLVE